VLTDCSLLIQLSIGLMKYLKSARIFISEYLLASYREKIEKFE
jgi:hypothetical protein